MARYASPSLETGSRALSEGSCALEVSFPSLIIARTDERAVYIRREGSASLLGTHGTKCGSSCHAETLRVNNFISPWPCHPAKNVYGLRLTV